MDDDLLAVAELCAKVLEARGKLLARAVDERLRLVSQIGAAGGAGSTDGALLVRELEEKLRAVDEAAGILRYGVRP